MLNRRKAQHVIHGDGFPRSTSSRKQSIETFILDGQFGNGIGTTGFDVLLHILWKFQPLEILLQYYHYFLNHEIANDPTVVCFQNHLGMLT